MINEKELRAQHSEKSMFLSDQLRERERILENYKRDHGRLEIFFEQILNEITPIVPLPVIAHHKNTETEYDAVIHISDTHIGAVQMADEIEGFGEYNSLIARQRGIQFAERVVNWVERHRTSYNIRKLTVLATGDLISGDIHDELKITNEFPAPVQCVRASELFAEQIAIFAPHFDQVVVEFLTEDNHGRLTKKPQAKEAGLNSFNYLVGYMSKLHLAGHSNVDFRIHPMYEKVVHVGNRQYLITHGHGIRGWMGIPWYSIERKQNREARARLEIIMDAYEHEMDMIKRIGFHKFVFGHFHFPIDTPLYSGNGSTQGTDAYDHQNGRYADPSQSAWLISPKYGEFDRTNFNLKRDV